MPGNPLPYPDQLPQHYYDKNYPATPVTVPTPPAPIPTPPNNPAYVPIPVTPQVPQSYYGDAPPPNPENGWFWITRSGLLYVYTEPGIWTQIGTNW